MSWAATVSGVGASTGLDVWGLRVDLGCLQLGMESEQGLVGLRADLVWVLLGRWVFVAFSH